jgi:hypothetical protein
MANANSTPVRCYDYKRNREEIYPSTILPFTTFPRSESDKTPLRLCAFGTFRALMTTASRAV